MSCCLDNVLYWSGGKNGIKALAPQTFTDSRTNLDNAERYDSVKPENLQLSTGSQQNGWPKFLHFVWICIWWERDQVLTDKAHFSTAKRHDCFNCRNHSRLGKREKGWRKSRGGIHSFYREPLRHHNHSMIKFGYILIQAHAGHFSMPLKYTDKSLVGNSTGLGRAQNWKRIRQLATCLDLNYSYVLSTCNIIIIMFDPYYPPSGAGG